MLNVEARYASTCDETKPLLGMPQRDIGWPHTARTSLNLKGREKVSDNGLCALAGLAALEAGKGSEAGQSAQLVI